MAKTETAKRKAAPQATNERYWTKQLGEKAPRVARFDREPYTVTAEQKEAAHKRHFRGKTTKPAGRNAAAE